MGEILKYLVCFILLLWLGCSARKGTNEATLEKISIGVLNGPSKISMVKMMDEYDSLDGIDMDYLIKNSPDLIITEMIKGTLEFAVLPTTSAALLYNRGIDYKLLGIPVWGTLWLAGTVNDIDQFTDLRGKTVYLMGRGMTPDMVFRYLIEQHDLRAGDDIYLNYSFPTPSELANVLQAGRVDLAVVSEPHASIIIGRNPGIRRILDITAEWNKVTGSDIPFTQSAFMVKEDFADRHPEIVDKIQEKYRESIGFLKAKPDSSAALLLKYEYFTDQKVAKQCVDNLHIHYEKASEHIPEIKKYLEVFYRMDPNVTGGKIPDEKFYYTK